MFQFMWILSDTTKEHSLHYFKHLHESKLNTVPYSHERDNIHTIFATL
jgi:hypothetical protein